MTRRRSPWTIVAIFVAAVVAVNLGLRELDQRTRSPGGPASSSFATAPNGVAAYADLLERFDKPAVRLREPLGDARLDRRATLVLLEPETLSADDGRALASFVRAGGRLVAGGNPSGWLDRVLDAPPRWEPSAGTEARAVGVPGVSTVRTAGEGIWEQGDADRVLVEAGGGALVLERPVGQGTVVLLADPSPLQNRLLAEADNAALGLALAGERPVAFAEDVHGYGPASGVDAIPTRWWWVFGGLLLAALVFALARGRRFGPPELPRRELPPARVEFAEAMATQLAKVRPSDEALGTARRVTRTRLTRALALAPDASVEEIGRRAAMRGFDPTAVQAVLGSGRGQAELLAVGRALRVAEREEAVG